MSQKKVNDKVIKWTTLISILIIHISRATNLFTNPRLWAEEGTQYLYNAMYSDFWRSIFFLPKYTAGYFNLISSIPCTIAAAFLSLENIPLFLTGFSFICFVIVVWRILFIPNIFIESTFQKVILGLALVFFISESGTAEALLNTINIQVYCGIYGLLILTTPNSWYTSKKIVLDSLSILLLALSGPYAIFIGLGYFLRLFLYPSRQSIFLFSALTGGAIIQLLSYLYLNINHYLSVKKTAPVHWDYITAGVSKFFILDPILSENLVKKLYFNEDLFYYTAQNIIDQERLYVQGGIGVLIILALLALYYFSLSKTKFILVLVTLIPVCFLTTYFAMNFVPGGRYSVVPSFIVGFFLISILSEQTKVQLKLFACLLIFSGLFVNIGDFWTYRRDYFAGPKDVPMWKNEVKKFNSEKGNYKFTIWPFPKWKTFFPYPHSLNLLNSKFEQACIQKTTPTTNIHVKGIVHLPKFSLKVTFDQPLLKEKVTVSFLMDEEIIYQSIKEINSNVIFENIGIDETNKKLLSFNKIRLAQSTTPSQITDIEIISPYNSF